MLDLRRQHALAAADIQSVAVEIGETQATILRNHRPQNALDAKFSAEFAIAAAAVAGDCGLAELSDAFVRRSDVQDVFPKVRISTRTDRLPEEPALAAYDRVEVVLRDGRKLASEPIAYPRGHFKRPVDVDRLWSKFKDCTVASMGEPRARALFERLQALDRLASVADLGRPVAQYEKGRLRCTAALPLSGLVVVEIGTSVAAPFAGQILADLGADVVKIENPQGGDDARNWGPPFVRGAAPIFNAINRNKRSAAIDLKDDAQRAALRRFILDEADVVLQNLRPGLLGSFGLDAATLARRASPR